MKLLLPWLFASFLYPISYSKESRAPEPVAIPKICRVVDEYGHPLGSTVYLTKANSAFYFLTNRHVAVYDHPDHSLYVEINGGRRAEFHYLWNFNEMAVGICFLPEDTVAYETILAEKDPGFGDLVFVEGYPDGKHWRGAGFVSGYGICSVPRVFGMVSEYSVYLNVVNGFSGGISGGGIFNNGELAALVWAGVDRNQLPPYVFEKIIGIPASVIKQRLAMIQKILPPDFVRRTFGDEEPAAIK